jgi:hypothetical protein
MRRLKPRPMIARVALDVGAVALVLVVIDIAWPDVAAEFGFGGTWHPAAIALIACAGIYVVCRDRS